MSLGKVGQTDDAYHLKQAVWTIPDFSSLPADLGKYYDCKPISFAGEELYFRIYPGGDGDGAKGHVSLFPMKKPSKTNNSVSCKISLKWAVGSAEIVIPESILKFKTDGRGHGYPKFFNRAELLRCLAKNKSPVPDGPALSDVLSLVFTLYSGNWIPTEFPRSQKTCRELDKLSKDFKNLLVDKKSCDATLVVKGKEFRVHKAVLIARSPVFAAMFGHDMAEKDTGTVEIPDCDEVSFGDFLGYMYSGQCVDVSFSGALELYRTAHKYDVPNLKSFCAKYLARHLTVEGVPSAVALADQYEEGELMSAVQDFFNCHVGEITVTEEWESLNKDDFHLANKLIMGASKYISALQQQILKKTH